MDRTDRRRPPCQASPLSVAPRTALGLAQLLHLLHALLELKVLALFVAVSLVLFHSPSADPSGCHITQFP